MFLVSQSLTTVWHSPALLYVCSAQILSTSKSDVECRFRGARLRITNKTTSFGARAVSARTEVRILIIASEDTPSGSFPSDLGPYQPPSRRDWDPQPDATFTA